MARSRPRQIQAMSQAPGRSPNAVARPLSVFLVAKRPPLANYPWVWRALARFIYRQINWCPDYGIEYEGVYDTEAAARYAASAPGKFYMELPLNVEMPEQTAQFGAHDFPLSEASAEYRNRKFPMVAVPRSALAKLDEQLARTELIVNEYHHKSA